MVAHRKQLPTKEADINFHNCKMRDPCVWDVIMYFAQKNIYMTTLTIIADLLNKMHIMGQYNVNLSFV